jgi:large subunit ribosomal protein L22
MANIHVKAQSKGIQMTPRKIGEVASLVRGRTVVDALIILEHTPRKAAEPIVKTIKSAQANAKNNHNAIGNDLVISELHVTPGPRMKRYRPVARGSAHPFQKRTTHVTVIVSGAEKARPKAKVTTKGSK